jgi:D-sedoheptulose 7-phosphate isomerase
VNVPTLTRIIRQRLQEAALVKLLLAESGAEEIGAIAAAVVKALKAGRRVVLFGNGGSAADAQHIACEMEGRFMRDRRPWPVLALTTNTSSLTAIGNDFDFAATFARLVRAHARKGDVAIGLSTSGNSPNVVEGLKAARAVGAVAIAFTGLRGGKVAKIAHLVFHAPSESTPRVQECHITAGHIICELAELSLPK